MMLEIFIQLHLSFEIELFEDERIPKLEFLVHCLLRTYLYHCMDSPVISFFFRTVIFKQLYLEAQMELDKNFQHHIDAQSPILSF